MRLEIIKKLDENSNPIAVFSNGKRKFIQLTDKPKENQSIRDLSESDIKKFLTGDNTNIDKLIDAMEKRLEESRYLDDKETTFKLTDKDDKNSVMFMPDFVKERELIYCHGPSGSGKSTLVKKYANEYKLLHPDNPIFVISKIENDPSFAGMDYMQIPLDLEVLSSIECQTFKDSLVVFDDTDTISNKKILEVVDGLKDIIAQEGRHYNTTAFICTHMGCNYKKTRILLNECQKFIIFPQSAGKKQAKNMFVTYGGMTNKKFESVSSEPSRWCMLNNSYPTYLVYENKIELL